MIHAFLEIYLNKAQSTLGDVFDYAINDCHIEGSDFVNLFIVSSQSKRLEKGDPAILLGKSGIEIAIDVVHETTGRWLDQEPQENFLRSKEYWIGWILAYYQWYTARSFGDLFKALPYPDLEKMYYTLHEADVTKFVDLANQKWKDYFKDPKLKQIRLACGYTQAKLAKLSGVSLRSIQMYEQRNKEINKASAESLFRLSRVLGCSMEDLLEL